MEQPPMEEIEYYGGYKMKRLASTSEGYEWLRRYIQKKLEASGVIPKDEANPQNPFSTAAHIMHESWCQYNSIETAYQLIESAIRYPPKPITAKRFSLKAFIKETSKPSLFWGVM